MEIYMGTKLVMNSGDIKGSLKLQSRSYCKRWVGSEKPGRSWAVRVSHQEGFPSSVLDTSAAFEAPTHCFVKQGAHLQPLNGRVKSRNSPSVPWKLLRLKKTFQLPKPIFFKEKIKPLQLNWRWVNGHHFWEIFEPSGCKNNNTVKVSHHWENSSNLFSLEGLNIKGQSSCSLVRQCSARLLSKALEWVVTPAWKFAPKI